MSGKPKLTIAAVVSATEFAPSTSKMDSASGQVAVWSSDRKHFLITLRKGDLKKNSNDFSMLEFAVDKPMLRPGGRLLVKMSSTSNVAAIRDPHWVDHDRLIVFLAHTGNDRSQVYAFERKTGRLRVLTHRATEVESFTISSDARRLVYSVDPSPETQKENMHRNGIVVSDQRLADLIRGQYNLPPNNWRKDYYVKIAGRPPYQIRLDAVLTEQSLVSISPDQRYLLLWGFVPHPKHEWIQYSDPYIREWAADSYTRQRPSPFKAYFIVDLERGSVTPLLRDAPILNLLETRWSADSKYLFVDKTYLPAEGLGSMNKNSILTTEYPVRVSVSVGTPVRIDRSQLSVLSALADTPSVDVAVEQGLNSPPRLVMIDRISGKRTILYDLNPNLRNVDMGKAQTVRWKDAAGVESVGGLYLPTDYHAGDRLPLVIQTHGFAADEFTLDGVSDWSGAYVARPLAARGIAVLQCCALAAYQDPSEEGEGSMRQIEGAVSYLERLGVVDPSRIAIMGFSRTVYQVGYILTHSRIHFAAATLVDGIDGGYFQYLVWGLPEFSHLNGADPEGSGLKIWLARSPGFNLDKIDAPIRLEAHGKSDGVLGLWQWYADLKYQHKPVEMTLFPDASHKPQLPLDRLEAQQQELDWMCFWLLHRRDSNTGMQQQ